MVAYPLTIKDFLDRAEAVYPGRVGVIDEPNQPAPSSGEVTYARLGSNARAQAARLDDLGVPRGARVAVVSHNSARFLTSFFGVSAWGRVLVPINFRLTRPEVEFIVNHSGAEVMLFDPELRDVASGLGVRHEIMFGNDDLLYRPGVEPEPWEDAAENALATLNYTSGTTAQPKGVELTHRNLWLNATVFGLHATITEDDVYLHTLPMFHANGWGMPYAISGIGGTHVILRQIDGVEILRRVKEHGVTILCAAPAVVNAILDAAARWEGEVPGRHQVRIICAGAPPPSRTIERIITELRWEFCQLYGLTETSPIVTFNRMRTEWYGLSTADQARKLMRAGVPALGVKVEIAPDGEVTTASNHNLRGYWAGPDETQATLTGPWFHTGDGGYIDDEGYLVITDRKKDVIISGGENVSSIEVEDALISHPAVMEAAVIGIPDETWGELVLGIVCATQSNLTEKELIEHCRSTLAGYKCPKRIEFVEALPRTATGKLKKFKLREPYWAGRQQQVN